MDKDNPDCRRKHPLKIYIYFIHNWENSIIKFRKGGSSSNLSKKALSVIFLFYRRYFSNPYISTILLYSSKLFAVEVSLVWMYTLPSRVTRSRCKYLIVRIFFLAKRILIKKCILANWKCRYNDVMQKS